MALIRTLADLQALQKTAYGRMDTRIKGNTPGLPQIRIAMATAGIAAGAKEIFDYVSERADAEGLNVVVTQKGIIGEGNGQPVVVELVLKDGQSQVFENVGKKKIDEILDTLKH